MERQARQTAQRCGVDGCEFQTKHTWYIKKHQARMHGIGDVDAEELRRKERECLARQPDHRCGVDGCEFQTKRKRDLKQHQSRKHAIMSKERAAAKRNARCQSRREHKSGGF
jgi:hypothetical protein